MRKMSCLEKERPFYEELKRSLKKKKLNSFTAQIRLIPDKWMGAKVGSPSLI